MTAFRSMCWLVLLGCLLLGVAQGQENPLGGGNPLAAEPPWAGTFADSQVKATFARSAQGFNGTITVVGGTHPAQGTVAANGRLAGTFTVGQRSFDMTAVMDGDVLVLTSGGTTYRLARQEEQNPDRRGPDLSHVRVGQKYYYTMTNAGAAPMTMIYEVKEVRDNLVNYTTQILMDMGQGPAPVGEPNPMEWRHVEAQTTTAPASGPRVDTSRATVTVSGIKFDCLVIASDNIRSWIPATGEVATFPEIIKSQTDGVTTLELTRIGGPEPDLSHVRVGQKYHYTMTTAGAAPMTMIYEVTRVGDNVVNYTTQLIMDMGRGPQPVGEPNPAEWSHVEAPATATAPPASSPRVEITRATVTVSGVVFDCMVITSANTRTWVPATGDVPVFPGLIKTQTDGRTTMELTRIEGVVKRRAR